MTYIDRLNHFNRWLESNALPGNAQLMYFKLLNVFNRAGWPESVQVDTLRLMQITGCQKEASYHARDKLVDAGFITYKKGSKGRPTKYFLSDNPTVFPTEKPTVSPTEMPTSNPTHKERYKNKTKNKNTSSLRSQGIEPTYDMKELEGLADLRLPEHW